jgi:hypothetical protein
MKNLLLAFALGLVLVGCTPAEVQNAQEQASQQQATAGQDGTLSFRFKGKNHVMKYGNGIDYAACSYIGTFVANTNSFMINGGQYSNLNTGTSIFIIKSLNNAIIGIGEYDNGNLISTNVPNAVLTITAQTQEYTSFTFKGDGIENGVGTKVPNKYVN